MTNPNANKPDPASNPETESPATREDRNWEDDSMQRVHEQLEHEYAEPTETHRQINMALLALFGILIFWAGWYMGTFSGGFDPMVYNPNPSWGATGQSGPVEFDPMAAGERFYKKNCSICHQADGLGQSGVYPPLVESEWVQGPEELVINIVLHGLNGPIEVKGNTYNNNMTPFRDYPDRDIAAVLTYVRTKPEWGNNASAISEEKVAEVRAQYGERTTPWTPDELLQLFPLDGSGGASTPEEDSSSQGNGQSNSEVPATA